MKDFPSDPMRQHNLFMAAICEDFAAAEWDTPRAKRILEIARQVNILPDELKRDGVWM